MSRDCIRVGTLLFGPHTFVLNICVKIALLLIKKSDWPEIIGINKHLINLLCFHLAAGILLYIWDYIKSGLYLSEDSIRVWTVLKFLNIFGDCIRVGTLFKSGFYWRLYGISFGNPAKKWWMLCKYLKIYVR